MNASGERSGERSGGAIRWTLDSGRKRCADFLSRRRAGPGADALAELSPGSCGLLLGDGEVEKDIEQEVAVEEVEEAYGEEEKEGMEEEDARRGWARRM